MDLIECTNKWLAGGIFKGKSILAAGLCLFAFCTRPWLRATALALVHLARPFLVIDYFSKEGAVTDQHELCAAPAENAG